MPTLQAFMEQIVAWPGPDGLGWVNLHWRPGEGYRGIWGTPFKEVGPFVEAAQHHTANPLKYPEIYFCLSVQRTTGEQNKFGGLRAARAMEGAMLFKAVWLDIDIKEDKNHYATIEEAKAALEAFRAGAGIPNPSAIVHSGGGLHIYWASDKPLTQEEWRPYAHGLHAEAIRLGLKCDQQCITNPVQLLRVPFTVNNKLKSQPRSVSLVHLGAAYDFATALSGLSKLAPSVSAAVTKPAPFDLSAFKTGPAKAFQHLNAGADNLASGIKHYNDSPLDPTEIFAKCGHYREALKTGGKDHANNLWALSVLGCTWFINGRSFAHAVSSGHKTYLKVETDIKYDEKVRYAAGHVGWPSCKSFEGAGSKVCATCLFKGKIKSPLNLAARSTVAAYSRQNSVPPPGLEIDLPSKYTINEKGFICEKIDRTLPNKTKIQEFEPLFYCKLKDFEAQSGERRLNFMTSLDGKNWGFASLSESVDLISEQAMVKALRRFGVKPCPNNQRKITEFVTSFMAKLDAAKERNRTLSFGWLYPPKGEDNSDQPAGFPIGFAYGGRINMSDGTSRAGGFSDQQIEEFYQPQGDEKYWWELLHIITAQHHPALEVVSLTGMAAPLMAFTGEYNGIFCAWSPESGATKSTAIAVGASVWANPKLTKERPFSTTQKGIIRKLGYLKNLPVYWDEINKDEKMDDIVDILGQLTEGGGGSRLKSDRTMHDIEQWQTLMLVGSNQSLVAAIQRQVKNTDAQLERVFEFQVPKREYAPEAQHAVSKIVDKLNTNYGGIGLKYGAYIGMHPKEVQALIDEVDTVFCRAVIPGNQERFRKCMAVTVYSAAVIANTHLGTDYHLTEIWDFLVEKFLEQRSNIVAAQIVAGTANHTQNTCTQFFKAHNRNALWVKNVPVSKRGRPPAIAHIAGPTKERPDRVDIRLAIDDRMIHISKTRFLEYLTGVKVTGRTVINGLIKHFNANEVGRLDLALGAGVIGGREAVIEIPVPAGSPFEHVLFAQTPMPDCPDGMGDPYAPLAPMGVPSIATIAVTAAKDLELVRAVSANTAPPSDPKGS